MILTTKFRNLHGILPHNICFEMTRNPIKCLGIFSRDKINVRHCYVYENLITAVNSSKVYSSRFWESNWLYTSINALKWYLIHTCLPSQLHWHVVKIRNSKSKIFFWHGPFPFTHVCYVLAAFFTFLNVFSRITCKNKVGKSKTFKTLKKATKTLQICERFKVGCIKIVIKSYNC